MKKSISSTKHIIRPKAGCRHSSGFTLVELVVVIAVIAILVGITTVGFGAWRERVAEAEVNSDLLGVKAGMEDARNRTDVYPTFTGGTEFDGSNSTRSVFIQSANVEMTYESGNATEYCVEAQSAEVASVIMFLDLGSSNKNPQSGTC